MTNIIDNQLEKKLDALNALVILYTSSNLPTNRAHHEYQTLLKYIEDDSSHVANLKALDAIQSVLCDPEGNPCFHGSDADRQVISDAMRFLESSISGERG